MNKGVYTLAASMVNQLNRVDTLANNLANVNTIAFKQDNLVEGSFNYYLEQKNLKKENATKIDIVTNTIPKIDGHYFNETTGAIVQTNNQLDFAIKNKNEFFKLENASGEILLTKDGSFKNIDGFLVSSEGYFVLNQANERIAIEDDFEEQIALVNSAYMNLDKQGDNNYKIKDITQIKNIATQNNGLLQGSIEKSNINAVSTMVGLIDSQRRLEQAQKASTGIDEINQKLIDKLSR